MDRFESLKEEKQQRILSASLKEFALRGYRDASTNTMTREAGISKGALFHYFGSKEKLYAYLMDYSRRQLEEKLLKDFPDGDDLIGLFLILGQRKAALAKTHPLFFEFLYRVFQEQPESPEYAEMAEKSAEMMQLLMSERIDTSRFREGIDLSKAIEICVWMSEGFARKYAQKHKELEPEELLSASEDLIETLRILIYKETP